MSEQQIQAFIAQVNSDDSLQAQVKDAVDSGSIDAVEELARKAGINITKEDLAQLNPPTDQEIEEGFVGPYSTQPWYTCSTNIGCK